MSRISRNQGNAIYLLFLKESNSEAISAWSSFCEVGSRLQQTKEKEKSGYQHQRARSPLTLYEGEDLLILLFGLTLLHQVDLVLQDEDVLQLHDLYGSQMLGCLRLWTGLVARWEDGQNRDTLSNEPRQRLSWWLGLRNQTRTNKQEGCIHDSSSVQHGCHQNVVTRTVNKRHMSKRKKRTMC